VVALALAGGRWLGPARTGRSAAPVTDWFLLGRVSSALAAVELPRTPAITGAERARVIAAVRRTPSVRAFEAWLGVAPRDSAAGLCRLAVP